LRHECYQSRRHGFRPDHSASRWRALSEGRLEAHLLPRVALSRCRCVLDLPSRGAGLVRVGTGRACETAGACITRIVKQGGTPTIPFCQSTAKLRPRIRPLSSWDTALTRVNATDYPRRLPVIRSSRILSRLLPGESTEVCCNTCRPCFASSSIWEVTTLARLFASPFGHFVDVNSAKLFLQI
jgi:hypothetical protein